MKKRMQTLYNRK